MLSIVIPCYNIAAFIGAALDSLLKQPYTINKDFEIICVDDCSTDDTLLQLHQYDQYGIKIIALDKNAGVSHARNEGLKHANGDFIWFFDADDLAASISIQTIFNALSTSATDIDAIRFYASYVEENSSIDDIKIIKQAPTNDNLYCFVIRHSFLSDKNISFCDDMTYSEDVAFICLCYINDMRIKEVPITLYYYRQRATSLMHSRNETKHFNSICRLPYYYAEYKEINRLKISDNQLKKLTSLVYDATQGCLMHAVKQPAETLTSVVENLRCSGLYPYPIRWNLLSMKYGIKVAFSKSIFLLAPVHQYLLMLNKFLSKDNAITD